MGLARCLLQGSQSPRDVCRRGKIHRLGDSDRPTSGVPTVPPASVSVLGTSAKGRSEVVPLENVSLAEALEEVERRMISDALRRHKGNISRAARELGLTRRGLYLKLDRYNISADLAAGSAKG